MATIRVTTVAGADGVVRLAIPVGEAGVEYDVVVTPKPATDRKPTPEELGWPPGFFENVIGSIDDDTFVAPPRSRTSRPVPSLDDEE